MTTHLDSLLPGDHAALAVWTYLHRQDLGVPHETTRAGKRHAGGPRGEEMPWKEIDVSTLKEEFILRALEPASNLSELCREFEISRKTGYKWLARFYESSLESCISHPNRTTSAHAK